MMLPDVYIDRANLDPESLARKLQLSGAVAFNSSRTVQREIANEVIRLLDSTIEVRMGESSGYYSMCIVDVDRLDFDKVKKHVAALDLEYFRTSGN